MLDGQRQPGGPLRPRRDRRSSRPTALRPGRDRRPAERRQVDAAQRAGRRRRSASRRARRRRRDTASSAFAPAAMRSSSSSTRRGSRRGTRRAEPLAQPRRHRRRWPTSMRSLLVVEAGGFGPTTTCRWRCCTHDKPVLLIANKVDGSPGRADTRRPGWRADADAPRVRRVRAAVGDEAGRSRAAARRIVSRYLPEQPWLVRRRRADRPQRTFSCRRDRARKAVPPDRRRAALRGHRDHRQIRAQRHAATDPPR